MTLLEGKDFAAAKEKWRQVSFTGVEEADSSNSGLRSLPTGCCELI